MFARTTLQKLAEHGSWAMVLISGATAGHFAAAGMSLTQWGGAVVAVAGSLSVAYAVRAWPSKGVAAKD